jgi:hypothetical protein
MITEICYIVCTLQAVDIACPAHLVPLELIIPFICGEGCKL